MGSGQPASVEQRKLGMESGKDCGQHLLTMMLHIPIAFRLLLYCLFPTFVESGGGSGLLVGLAKEGKLSGNTDNWPVLVMILSAGALLIVLAALAWFLWRRYKKR